MGNSARRDAAPGRQRSVGRTDTCICMAESLCCAPETTTLLISYTSIQNKLFKKSAAIEEREGGSGNEEL